MLTLSLTDATASTVSAAEPATSGHPLPPGFGPHGSNRREPIRHMLFGTPQAVQSTILHLHQLGYADPNDWSRPMGTGRVNEVMAILTKRISTL